MPYLNNKNAYWLLALLCAALFLPLLGNVHLFDWDEANFAECAREMILRGNYSQVTIDFSPFYEKPPFFFWLQTLAMHVLGMTEYAARLPNAVVGILSMLVAYYIARRLGKPKIAWVWVLLYLASWTPHLYFKSGIIDPTFNLFIFLAIYCYFRHDNPQIGDYFLSAIGISIAVITKGPVALLILGLCIFFYHLIYKREQFRTPRFYVEHVLYLLVILLFSSLWYVYTSAQDGGAYIHSFLTYQMELLTQDVATHGQPFYYHFIVLLIGCFPASILLLNRKAWSTNDQNTEGVQRFSRVMIVLFWVVLILFSLVRTKIVHYSSMCYLPLTYLAAKYWVGCIEGEAWRLSKVSKIFFLLLGIFWSLVLIGLPILGQNTDLLLPYIQDPNAQYAIKTPVDWSLWESIPGFFLLATIVFFYKSKQKSGWKPSLILCISLIFCIQYALYHFTPKIEKYSQGVAIEKYQKFAGKKVDLSTIGYKSYAILFYAQRQPESKNYAEKYYVCHESKLQEILDEKPTEYVLEESDYGFVILKKSSHENTTQNTQ